MVKAIILDDGYNSKDVVVKFGEIIRAFLLPIF